MVWENEETEIINDSGFVYRRRKRRRTLEEEAQASTANDPSPLDLQPQLKKRKKQTLLKLKQKYQQEILHWEHLSNTFRALEQKAHQSQQLQQLQQPQQPQQPSSSSSLVHKLDELLGQVEIQESIMKDCSMLCDTAEAYVRAEEERRKKEFLELPVWDLSPRRLIASLCREDDDDDCNDNDNDNT